MVGVMARPPAVDPAGDLALIVTVVAWASAFPAITVALQGYSPWSLGLLRLGVAALALGVVAVALRPAVPRGRLALRVVLVELCGQTLYQVLLMGGQTVVAAGPAALLIATAPLFSVLIARVLLGERIGRRWVGLVVAFAGAAAVALTGSAIGGSTGAVPEDAPTGTAAVAAALGVVAVLAAALCQGAYHVLVKPVAEEMGAFPATFWSLVAGAALSLPALPALNLEVTTASATATWGAVLLGVVPSAVGYRAWSFAVTRSAVARSTVALYLVPVVALLLAWAWLGDRPHPLTLLGGAMALAGVVLVRRVAERPHVD
jgi:drug/metabolite transporter (DMT)-like permease